MQLRGEFGGFLAHNVELYGGGNIVKEKWRDYKGGNVINFKGGLS